MNGVEKAIKQILCDHSWVSTLLHGSAFNKVSCTICDYVQGNDLLLPTAKALRIAIDGLKILNSDTLIMDGDTNLNPVSGDEKSDYIDKILEQIDGVFEK